MNYNRKKIAILLSTFNSERYLQELIESILFQDFIDWTLYIRDDGSKDGTLKIVEQYSESCSNISFITSPKYLGAKRGFFFLLENIDSPYYMFCDHDDVWLPGKISSTYRFLLNVKKNEDIPVVVGTDLQVVDSQLRVISESLFKFADVDLEWFENNQDYIHIANPFVGCTMMFNKLAREASLPLPAKALMHDWWVAQVAYKEGRVALLKESTILYRQHDGNVVGTVAVDTSSLQYWTDKLRNIKSVIRNINNVRKMSKLNGCNNIQYCILKIKQIYRKLK